ncbi:diphosphomevalonate decarboxylase [candidate division KSB1 bacterium]|nr:diphosphomevalonate decarboxylase [candidate division KSB1 bacterium]
MKASAIAFSNIALVKYWGRSAEERSALNIPLNDTVSMTKYGLVDGICLQSHTTVEFSEQYDQDTAVLNSNPLRGSRIDRIRRVIDALRELAGIELKFMMQSRNDFPTMAGLASSASGFAALGLAAASALGLTMSREKLSSYVRLGSGSAARSVFGGFVYLYQGGSHETAYAEKICSCDEFDMSVAIAIIDENEKPVSSEEGHATAHSSPFNDIRIIKSQQQAEIVRKAILENDFTTVGRTAEENCKYMHAVMMTSDPPLFYWSPATLNVMKTIMKLRSAGMECYFTIDAGPNVHCLCHRSDLESVAREISGIDGVQRVVPAVAGKDAFVTDEHLF